MKPPRVYTVEHYEHGMLVRGQVPLSDFEGLARLAGNLGYDRMHGGIASKFGAVLAVSSEEGLEAWVAEIEAEVHRQHGDDRLSAWLDGTDTGLSSLTMVAVLRRGTPHGDHARRLLEPVHIPPRQVQLFGESA